MWQYTKPPSAPQTQPPSLSNLQQKSPSWILPSLHQVPAHQLWQTAASPFILPSNWLPQQCPRCGGNAPNVCDEIWPENWWEDDMLSLMYQGHIPPPQRTSLWERNHAMSNVRPISQLHSLTETSKSATSFTPFSTSQCNESSHDQYLSQSLVIQPPPPPPPQLSYYSLDDLGAYSSSKRPYEGEKGSIKPSSKYDAGQETMQEPSTKHAKMKPPSQYEYYLYALGL